MQYDERGRPYIDSQQLGRRIYVSPGAVRTSTDPRDQAFVANTPETPDNFFRTSNWNQYTGEEDRGMNWGNIGALATGAYLGSVALPAVLGSAPTAAQGASTAASEAGGGILPSANIAVPNAVARSVTTGAGTGGGNGMLGSLGKLFGKGGLDPTMLLLSGLSMFGGGEGRQSFKGKGTADPVAMLQAALARNEAMGQSLQNRGPARLRSSAVSAPPQPVNLPGLGLQIGGGLGTDPALADPTLLEGRGLSDMTNQPYPQRQAPRQAQRRNPSNG